MSIFNIYELVINLDHNIPSSVGEGVLKLTKDNLHHPEMENVKKKLHTYPYFTSDVKYPYILNNLDYATRVEFFFNKTEFVKYLTNNTTTSSNIVLSTEDRRDNNQHNVMFMIELLFPTKFPTYNNISDSYNRFIKHNTGITNIQFGFITNFFKTKYYSYINYQGTIYTFRRSIWLNDFLNHPGYYDLRNNYEKFISWQKLSLANIKIAKIKDLENEFNKLFSWFKHVNKYLLSSAGVNAWKAKEKQVTGKQSLDKFIRYYILLLHTFFYFNQGVWTTDYDDNDQRNLIKPFLNDKVFKYFKEVKNNKKNLLWNGNVNDGNIVYNKEIHHNKKLLESDRVTMGYLGNLYNSRPKEFDVFYTNMGGDYRSIFKNDNLITNFKTDPDIKTTNEKKEMIYKNLLKRTFKTNSILINRVLKDSMPEEYSNLYYTIAGSGGSGFNRLSSYKGKSRVKADNSQLQDRINSIQIDDVDDSMRSKSSSDIYTTIEPLFNDSVTELFQFLEYVYNTKIIGDSSISLKYENPEMFEDFLNIGITTNENNNPKQYEIYLMADFFKGEINDNNKDLLLCDYTSNRLGQLFDDITQGTSSERIEPWNAKTHRLELMDLNDIEKRIQKYEDEDKDKQDTSNISDNSAHNYYTSNSDKLNSNLSQIINQLNIMFNLTNAEIDVDEQQIQEEILNIVDEDIINKVMDRARIQDRKLLLEIQKIINNFNSRLAELKIEIESENDYALQEEMKKQNIFYNELHKIPKYLLENENNKPQAGGKKRKSKKSKATIIKRVTRKNRKN